MTDAHRAHSTASGSSEDARMLFSIWSFLLAAGVAFHQAMATNWALWSVNTALALVAISLMVRPSSIPRFFLLIACHMVDTAIDLPFVVNHVAVQIMVDVGILLTCWLVYSRLQRIDSGAVYLTFAPVVRVVTLMLYFFAALAKVNSGFFDPSLSSAVTLFHTTAKVLPVPTGEWTNMPVIIGTVVVEFGIPLLLLIPATRVAGVVFALGFHGIMATAGHPAFSGLAPVFLFPFLPDDLPERLRRLAAEFPGGNARFQALRRAVMHPAGFVVLAALWILLSLAHTQGWIPDKLFRAILYHPFGMKFWVYPYLLFLMGVVTLACLRPPTARPAGLALGMKPALAVIPAVMLFNSLCPYLGLKTQSSLTMFSNLQTEGDQWNHYWMPESMRVFDFQDELVRIIDSDDPLLQQVAAKGKRWVYFEFRRYLSQHPDTAVTYEYEGRTVQLARAADDGELSRPIPLAMRKALWFRGVAPPESNGHRH